MIASVRPDGIGAGVNRELMSEKQHIDPGSVIAPQGAAEYVDIKRFRRVQIRHGKRKVKRA